MGLVQLVERLTSEREVAGSIPMAGPILSVLKKLRNEGTSFALQQVDLCVARMTIKMAVLSPVGDIKNSVPN